MLRKNCTAVLLLTAMLASLAACGGESAAVDTTAASGGDATTEAATGKPASGLPEVDFGGEAFTFLNGNTAAWMTTFVVTAEEENGDTINDAIYRRNVIVEDKYNVVIKEISTKSVRSDVTNAVAAGDDSFDVALMVSGDAHTITLEGAAMDYAKIPHVDVTKPWWVEGSVTGFSMMNHVYYAISEFDTTHYDGVRTLFFNKEMAEEYKLESIYDLVYAGKWTLDKFRQMGMTVAHDLNGDSVWGKGDQFGYTSYESIGAQTLMTGVGVFPSLGKDADDLPILNTNTEACITKLIKLTNILNDTPGFRNPDQTGETSGGLADFIDGRVLFYNETLGNINYLREMQQDFGIIPTPKYDETQDGYHHLGGNPYFMLVPVTTPNLEKTGVIMEALAYESVGIIDTAFYDTFLQGKAARDEDSIAMLDLIFDTLTYYHAVARNYVNANLTKMVWNNDVNFASYFAENKSTIETLIEEAIDAYNANVK